MTSDSPEPRPSPGCEGQRWPPEIRFGFWKSLLFATILVTAVLVVVEGSLRIWVYFFRDQYQRYDPASESFVLVPGSYRGGFEINSQGFVGDELAPGGPDLWRIVALGDSCTFGGGNGRHTYPAHLENQLKQDPPDPNLRYEVINAGVEGLNSAMALRRLREKVVPLAPEVVTIYIGWNDLMKSDPTAQAGNQRFAALARVLDELWIVKGLRKLIFFYVRPQIDPPATGPASRTGRFADFEPRAFARNLRALIAEVREADAVPVLLTLPTVLRMDMTQRDLIVNRVVFPYYRSAYGVGDLLDLIGSYNQAIREAGRREDVPVVDVASTFRDLPDPEPYFYDTMHPTERGRTVIAAELHAALERHGLLAPPPGSPHPSASEAPVALRTDPAAPAEAEGRQ